MFALFGLYSSNIIHFRFPPTAPPPSTAKRAVFFLRLYGAFFFVADCPYFAIYVLNGKNSTFFIKK